MDTFCNYLQNNHLSNAVRPFFSKYGAITKEILEGLLGGIKLTH